MAQQEGDGQLALWPQLLGAGSMASIRVLLTPSSSVLLRARWLCDADVDKERRGRDASAILGEKMDVAVACRGDSEALAECCPHPAL